MVLYVEVQVAFFGRMTYSKFKYKLFQLSIIFFVNEWHCVFKYKLLAFFINDLVYVQG